MGNGNLIGGLLGLAIAAEVASNILGKSAHSQSLRIKPKPMKTMKMKRTRNSFL